MVPLSFNPVCDIKRYLKKKQKTLYGYILKKDQSDLSYELNSNVLKKYLNDAKFKQNLIEKQTKLIKFQKKLSIFRIEAI